MDNNHTPFVTVLVPCRNEEKYIENCLISVVEFDYNSDRIEVFFIDGESEDKTAEIIRDYSAKYDFIQYIPNPERTVPFALNKAIEKAKGDYIIRLDAHSEFPKDYIKKLVKWHQKLSAGNIGGVWKTEIKNSTPVSEAIKSVLSHKFGVGNSYFRTGISGVMEVDTVPFGSYQKKIFDEVGNYNVYLTRNQDIELNKRILKAGKKIYLVSEIECTYFARENLRAIAKNNYQNGLWNLLTLYYTKDRTSLSLRHFIPLAFLLSLIIPLILAFFWLPFAILSTVSFIVYLMFTAVISLSINHNKTTFLDVFKTFLVLHFSYGYGSLVGCFKYVWMTITNKKMP